MNSFSRFVSFSAAKGIPAAHVHVEEGDADTAPYGLGTYPPNLTFPFGSYICVVDIDRGTGQVKIRRFVAVDDCGNAAIP